MRVLFVAAGSMGDVFPYLALGRGLSAKGFDVRVATHAVFEERVREQGLDFTPLTVDPRTVPAFGPLEIVLRPRFVLERMESLVVDTTREVVAAASDADVLICSSIGMSVGALAGELLSLPVIPAKLAPEAPTSAYPSPAHAELASWVPRAIRSRYNRLTYLAEVPTWPIRRPVVNRARSALGLPPLGLRRPRWAPPPTLFGFSSHVVPKPDDWGDDFCVSGYWHPRFAERFTPPPELERFLAAGAPPVCFGFGSMRPPDSARAAATLLGAVERAGVRAVFIKGWSEISSDPRRDDVLVVDFVPHEWLLPRVALFVHHGGAGATAAALRAGVPSIPVPFGHDQHFWASRLAALGAGAKAIPIAALTEPRLTGAIRSVLTQASFRSRARELAASLRDEDGVATAVAFVERVLDRHMVQSTMS